MDGHQEVRRAYEASYHRLVVQVFGLVGDMHEASDLVSEAFARALKKHQTFAAVDNKEAWLRTVAVNLARSRTRRRRLFDVFVRTGRIARGVQTVPGLSPDHVALVTALQQVSPVLREALVLHYLADQSVAACAETLGVPEGTVKARLSRGRAALSRHFSESDMSLEVTHA